MKQTICVATFEGPKTHPMIQRVPRPKPGPRAALIKIEACGVCGTDLHILKGHWPKPLPWPLTLGHELAGVIEEIGESLTQDFMGNPLQPGDRIMLPPLMPCGECDYCVHYPTHANRCLNPTYYGRYIPFEKPPHLWGGWAEMVYVDLDLFPATKIYRLPDSLSSMMGSLTEPLTCCIRAINRAIGVGGFRVGDTVVIQGSGPIGLLTLVSAREMGAGRVLVVGAPEIPRLSLCREFGADATVCLDDHDTPQKRIDRVRDLVGNYGADLVIDCSGHPSAGPEGIEMLRDGGTYVEMGQFTDVGSVETNWHRICSKDINLLGSWAFTANDIALGIGMMSRIANRYPWQQMQTPFPFSASGIQQAVATAMNMECIKAVIVPH